MLCRQGDVPKRVSEFLAAGFPDVCTQVRLAPRRLPRALESGQGAFDGVKGHGHGKPDKAAAAEARARNGQHALLDQKAHERDVIGNRRLEEDEVAAFGLCSNPWGSPASARECADLVRCNDEDLARGCARIRRSGVALRELVDELEALVGADVDDVSTNREASPGVRRVHQRNRDVRAFAQGPALV